MVAGRDAVSSIRAALKVVRWCLLGLAALAIAYFLHTVVGLGRDGTLDVLGEAPAILADGD